MKTLKELRAALAAKKKAGAAALAEYNRLGALADRDEAQEARFAALNGEIDALEAECTALQAEIDQKERADRRAALFSNSALTLPGGGRRITSSEPNPERTGGFHSLAEFAVAAHTAAVAGHFDARLTAMTAAAPANTINPGGNAGEGFLVPPQFREEIWGRVWDGTGLLNMFVAEPTGSNAVALTKDETTPWGATGVKAQWRGQGQDLKATKPATAPALVQLHPVDAFVVVDDELLADAPRLNNRITVNAADALRWTMGEAIMTGDGVGKPRGFMASGAPRVTIAAEAGQSAGTIVLANIAKMYARLLMGGGTPFFMSNSEVLRS